MQEFLRCRVLQGCEIPLFDLHNSPPRFSATRLWRFAHNCPEQDGILRLLVSPLWDYFTPRTKRILTRPIWTSARVGQWLCLGPI